MGSRKFRRALRKVRRRARRQVRRLRGAPSPDRAARPDPARSSPARRPAPAPAPSVPSAPSAPPVPPDPPVPEKSEFVRDEHFPRGFTQRALDEFVTAPSVAWADLTDDRDAAELAAWVDGQEQWRYHHGLDRLQGRPNLYDTYAQRVDAMLEMCDWALRHVDIDPNGATMADLAASEGFVTNHFLARGAKQVDAFELSQPGIDRFRVIRALKGLEGSRLGRIDLENVAWSRALGRYDVVLALGIIYHVESPMMFARNLYEITGRVAVVESDTPVFTRTNRFRGHGVVYLHRDQVTLEQGNVRLLTEMRPDRLALAEMLLTAGFSRVTVVPPAVESPSKYYDSGEKSVMVAER